LKKPVCPCLSHPSPFNVLGKRASRLRICSASLHSYQRLFNRLLGMNEDRGEKDTDARRFGRRVDDRRLEINSFPVTIRPINTSAPLIYIVAAVMPASPLLIPSVVMTPPFVFAEGRRCVNTADHYEQDKSHHDLARY
jgi:hypothetical protein